MLGLIVYAAPWFAQRTGMRALFSGLLGFGICALFRWSLLPADTTWNLVAGFVVSCALSGTLGAILGTMIDDKFDRLSWALTLSKGLVVALYFVATLFASSAMFNASRYHLLAQAQVVDVPQGEQPPLSPIDPQNVLAVPYEIALQKARDVVGQYGSQFTVEKLTLQIYKGRLVYAGLLDFKDYRTQRNAKVSPGFVVVDATNPLVKPVSHFDHKFRVTENGYLSQNLFRVVRAQYPSALLSASSVSFELDDETGKAYWTVSYGHEAIGSSEMAIDGVIVMDPETGLMQQYALDKMPTWIDQVVPADVAARNLTSWGEYGYGWLNSWWGERGVKKITGASDGNHGVVGANAADGNFYWSTGMTSPNPKDDSLIALAFVNARTGKTMIYNVNGRVANEDRVQATVKSRYKAQGWAAGYPLPYNINGKFTYVTPVYDEDRKVWQRVAMTAGDAMERTGDGKDLTEALREYKAALTRSNGAITDKASQKTISGTVDRIQMVPGKENGATLFFISVKEDNTKVFQVDLNLTPFVAVTQPADKVTLDYVDTQETLLVVTKFANERYTTQSK